jgi:hypothetical protein
LQPFRLGSNAAIQTIGLSLYPTTSRAHGKTFKVTDCCNIMLLRGLRALGDVAVHISSYEPLLSVNTIASNSEYNVAAGLAPAQEAVQ